ncbi:hypothetical protein EVAR_35220_1 [Eumeta japonica]|uniref:Uncharacterized protein n=1 Tax=Eumeta variegata TaxID=151549 RepID=A0A4C1VCX8_EUMVA|nr:hypothetical protein EVAR_35220_1 [Eumeta japonica]
MSSVAVRRRRAFIASVSDRRVMLRPLFLKVPGGRGRKSVGSSASAPAHSDGDLRERHLQRTCPRFLLGIKKNNSFTLNGRSVTRTLDPAPLGPRCGLYRKVVLFDAEPRVGGGLDQNRKMDRAVLRTVRESGTSVGRGQNGERHRDRYRQRSLRKEGSRTSNVHTGGVAGVKYVGPLASGGGTGLPGQLA